MERPSCAEHADEYCSYFCFSCVSDCICPECIIHGVHKDHEVKTVKKAYPIIKEKIDEINNGLETKVKNV